MTNSNVDKRQGYILSANDVKNSVFLALLGTRIWPIHLYDPAGSIKKPFPTYKGSARIEGNDNNSLVAYFCDKQGFQPAVLKLLGARLKHVETGDMHTFKEEEGLYICTVVRYTEVGVPELRIITAEANEKLTRTFGWQRQPVRAEGDTDAERHQFCRELVRSTRREDEPELPTYTVPVIPADITLDEDPFA